MLQRKARTAERRSCGERTCRPALSIAGVVIFARRGMVQVGDGEVQLSDEAVRRIEVRSAMESAGLVARSGPESGCRQTSGVRSGAGGCDSRCCTLNWPAMQGPTGDGIQGEAGQIERAPRESFPASCDFPEPLSTRRRVELALGRRARDSARQNLGPTLANVRCHHRLRVPRSTTATPPLPSQSRLPSFSWS